MSPHNKRVSPRERRVSPYKERVSPWCGWKWKASLAKLWREGFVWLAPLELRLASGMDVDRVEFGECSKYAVVAFMAGMADSSPTSLTG